LSDAGFCHFFPRRPLYADLADLLVDGGTGTNTIYGRPRIPLPVGR